MLSSFSQATTCSSILSDSILISDPQIIWQDGFLEDSIREQSPAAVFETILSYYKEHSGLIRVEEASGNITYYVEGFDGERVPLLDDLGEKVLLFSENHAEWLRSYKLDPEKLDEAEEREGHAFIPVKTNKRPGLDYYDSKRDGGFPYQGRYGIYPQD